MEEEEKKKLQEILQPPMELFTALQKLPKKVEGSKTRFNGEAPGNEKDVNFALDDLPPGAIGVWIKSLNFGLKANPTNLYKEQYKTVSEVARGINAEELRNSQNKKWAMGKIDDAESRAEEGQRRDATALLQDAIALSSPENLPFESVVKMIKLYVL